MAHAELQCEWVTCSYPGCDLPATVTPWQPYEGPDGPVMLSRIMCPRDHVYLEATDKLDVE